MATFASIKSKLVTILEARPNLDSNSVFGFEPEIGDVLQDPFAVVIASGNENDFASSSENKRSFGFSIRLYVERKTRGVEAAETLMQTMVDNLINALDQDYTLGGEVLVSQAAPSAWGYILGVKEYRTAEIIVIGQDWYDVT